MKRIVLSKNQIVSDLLTCWPQTAPVFLKHRMNCVGCAMNRFETLAEVAAAYNLNTDAFLTDLQTALQEK